MSVRRIGEVHSTQGRRNAETSAEKNATREECPLAWGPGSWKAALRGVEFVPAFGFLSGNLCLQTRD